MKILIVVDKIGSAIDRLAKMVKDHNPQHTIEILPVHPKRNDSETLYEASQLLEWCDVLDIHYWRSGEVLRTPFAKQFESRPRVLFHFNPYDVDKLKWPEIYDKVVVGNETIHSKIPYAHLIPYAVDLDFFKFNDDYAEKAPDDVVNMCVARIEGKKGVLEVAKACKDLGYKLRLVGRVSSGAYIEEVLKTGAVTFVENATEEGLLEEYHNSTVHVCNSVDGFESGTLPILESMAVGLPVLTTNIGHVPDINNGKNMVVRAGDRENLEDLKENLKSLMENKDWRLKLRENAWKTVRGRDSRIMARMVGKLYNQLYMPDRKLASVIIPTRDNPEALVESLVGALYQDYKKYEVIVVDSGETSVKPIVDKAASESEVPVKYLHFPHKDNYTLAEARNRGVIEAEGELLVFCDDRIKMDPNAVTEFAKFITDRAWLWGIKDDSAKGFVENFSAILREDLVSGGMFNERIQWYGGMTQDIRTRFERRRGFSFILVDSAKAKGIKKSKGRARRKDSIREAKYMLYKLYG